MRVTKQSLTLILFVATLSCYQSHPPRPFNVTSVTITGPAEIANGATAVYTVTFTTTPAVNFPGLGVQLFEEDGFLRQLDDWLSHSYGNVVSGTGTALLPLSCVDNTVRGDDTRAGNDPNSGEGGPNIFGWPDPADVYAEILGTRSAVFEVSCR